MVRIHREPPVEGPPARGSGLYPLRRQISAARQVRHLYPLPICRAGSSTDQNSWPTPNRRGFNSRTAHHAGLARRSSPRSITARRWFDSNILHHFCSTWVTGRDGRCARLLSETRLVRFQRHPPELRDWQVWICTRLLSETKQVRFLPRSPFFNNLRGAACCLRAVSEGQARDLGQRLTFLIGNHVPVNVSDTARMSLPG